MGAKRAAEDLTAKLLTPHANSLMLSGMNDTEKLKFIAQQAQNMSSDGTLLTGDAYQSTVNAFGPDLVNHAIKQNPEILGETMNVIGPVKPPLTPAEEK